MEELYKKWFDELTTVDYTAFKNLPIRKSKSYFVSCDFGYFPPTQITCTVERNGEFIIFTQQ